MIVTATAIPTEAHAGGVGLFATEYTQLLNYAELVGQLEKQVMMVENQMTQIADMAKRGITISNQLFGTVESDIVNLNRIMNTGQSLAYTLSNMDGTFRLRFPGYVSTTNYGQQYSQWGQTSLDSTLGCIEGGPGCRTISSTATQRFSRRSKAEYNGRWTDAGPRSWKREISREPGWATS